jgi:4-amino-4-deoxy-L-arabinose transferase-like glycosyltransferase
VSRRLAEAVVAAACLAAVVLYLAVALLRIRYPFELQWMEGGSVEHVRRLLAGRSIYPPPSVDFASYTYPPLYFWVSAAVARVTGVGFFSLRVVSFLSSVGTLTLLGLIGHRESGRWLPGLVAAGVFAAAFRVTGAWYDIARVDSLFLFLLVAALFTLRGARTWPPAAAAGALLSLSALTKQTAILVGVPIALYVLVRRPRLGLAFVAGFLTPLAVVSGILDVASSGWYRFSTLEVLLGHPVERTNENRFLIDDLGRHLWPALLVLAIVALAAIRQRVRPGRAGPGPDNDSRGSPGRVPPDWALYSVAGMGMVGSSWISRLHSGGYNDVLIPAFAGIALAFGLAVGQFRSPSRATELAVAGACLLQLALLAYTPAAQIPSRADLTAGRQLVSTLRSAPGDVFVVAHPFYAVMAGKAGHAQAAAISDIIRSRPSTATRLIRQSIADAVHSQRFSAIVFDTSDDHRGFPTDLDRYYRRIPQPVLDTGAELRPVTDIAVRPTEWWVARRVTTWALNSTAPLVETP